MSDYRQKLDLLQQKIIKLKAKEKRLVIKRKEYIADLAEQVGLLAFSDQFLATGLQYLKDCLIDPKKNIFLNSKYEEELITKEQIISTDNLSTKSTTEA